MSISEDSPGQISNSVSEGADVDALLQEEAQQSGTFDAQAKSQVNAENKRLDKKDKRNEMTVVAALLAVSLIDGFMFAFIQNWSAPLVIGAIQLLAALIFAKNYGIEEIQVWLNKVIEKFPSNGSRKNMDPAKSTETH